MRCGSENAVVASQKEDIVASLIILRKMNDLPGSADGATLHTVDDDIFVADEMEQPLMQRDRAAILGSQLRNALLQGTHQRAVTVLQQVDGLITRPHDQKLLVPGIEQGSMGTYPHTRHFLNPLEST